MLGQNLFELPNLLRKRFGVSSGFNPTQLLLNLSFDVRVPVSLFANGNQQGVEGTNLRLKISKFLFEFSRFLLAAVCLNRTTVRREAPDLDDIAAQRISLGVLNGIKSPHDAQKIGLEAIQALLLVRSSNTSP